MKKIIPLTLLISLLFPAGLFAQPTGPLLSRFPYTKAEEVPPVFDLGALLSQLEPTPFPPRDYSLPDTILFSKNEGKWVETLRTGFSQVQEGDFEAAKTNFIAFLNEYPEHVPTRIALADIYYSIGDYASAEKAYLALLADYPNHFQALNNLAWMYSTSPDSDFRRPEVAREYVRRAMVAAPQSHHVWSTLSQTLYAQSRFEEAVQAASTAVNLAQRSGAPSAVLVSYLLQLDRTRSAVQASSFMD